MFLSEAGAPTSSPLSGLGPQMAAGAPEPGAVGRAGPGDHAASRVLLTGSLPVTAWGKPALPFGLKGLLGDREAEPFLQETRGPSREGCVHSEGRPRAGARNRVPVRPQGSGPHLLYRETKARSLLRRSWAGVASAATGWRFEPPAGSAASAKLSEELRVALDAWKASQDPSPSQPADGEGGAAGTGVPPRHARPEACACTSPPPQASRDRLPGSVSLTRGAPHTRMCLLPLIQDNPCTQRPPLPERKETPQQCLGTGHPVPGGISLTPAGLTARLRGSQRAASSLQHMHGRWGGG